MEASLFLSSDDFSLADAGRRCIRSNTHGVDINPGTNRMGLANHCIQAIQIALSCMSRGLTGLPLAAASRLAGRLAAVGGATLARSSCGPTVISGEPTMHRILCVALLVLSFAPAYAADYPSMSGRELYRKFCASCHGTSAQGDGPIAKSLKTKPADLTQIARRYGGAFPAKRIEEVVDGRVAVIAHGPSSMPVWGQEFTRSQEGTPAAERDSAQVIHKIVEYLRSLQGSPPK